MVITKGQKIKALYHTHFGGKTVDKYAWHCSCGRIYQNKKDATICDESDHKIRKTIYMIWSPIRGEIGTFTNPLAYDKEHVMNLYKL